MTRTDTPVLLLTGPPRHGVARYAADLAEHVRALDGGARVLRVDDPGDLPDAADGVGRAHLHVTDRLLGASPDAAALRLLKNCAASLRAVESIRRPPSWAILPPTSAFAV